MAPSLSFQRTAFGNWRTHTIDLAERGDRIINFSQNKELVDVFLNDTVTISGGYLYE